MLKTTLTAGGTPRQRRMERRPPADLLPFIARNHARQAKPDRALAPLSMLATLAPPAANAAWRGRGAEEKVRGAEPSGGFAARRRKRAGRGYMLPLRQRTLPPMPEQRNTSRTEPSTLYYNRAFQEVLLRIRGSKSGMPFPVFEKAAEYVYPVSRPPSPVNPAGG